VYQVPATTHQQELVVRKSRFISRASLAENRADAMRAVVTMRRDYAEASHHCWAYVLGPPSSPTSIAMSDDGEPAGTAGKPILNVLQHKQVGSIMVVVARYFGGIKLGAGGLIRAYSSATQQVMESLPLSLHVARHRFKLQVDFSQEQNLRYWLEQYDGILDQIEYGEAVSCLISLPETAVGTFEITSRAKGWMIVCRNFELLKPG